METKRINIIAYLGWVLLFIVLFYRGCNSEPQFTEKVITKEVKGSIVTKEKVINVPIVRTIKDTAGTGFYVNQIDKLFEENNRMQLEFMEMDSLAKIEAYNKAIEINAFKQQFEDKYINAYVSGEVAGNVKQMRFDYTIKPQEIKVNAPKNKFFIGLGVSNNSQFNAPLFNAGIGIQNKKSNLLIVGFDSEKRIGLNYFIKLF